MYSSDNMESSNNSEVNTSLAEITASANKTQIAQASAKGIRLASLDF